ncbi:MULTISPECIES: DegT/DnrJ/EryC1/StrS aminotransferase family protein [unclassified Okeania]|uniref:DegT/DnrJ/EryC1/StrS family aminotransferase n=1 Tax=unclassified Okeania TaxID=2634635 RepID=UPI0013BB3985|nr:MULTISPECIES: DegT/DnrJ/EryC1/StrS family aminotransferase [unclassified Okeania]NES76450.1 DegT/DnrJ/EryC1/StrS family aminotransferase [Okeania sp. SIO1H4]NET14185.1 DegT/DnrJ/EryC1/StrS family aminotransferase [Okeania sp. SIO1H6]NET22458.1 DegT/DnrJ/EryC1/StrS family aminotransferase [Okeania sp. SIO1H5]NET95921.1 DegT/DnrJ/EryC1/StrS family aminotransferase [Okeania sp. SIO1H2]
MTNIPPLDLTQQYKSIAEEINSRVQEVLSSGRYIGGFIVDEFEQQFANYIDVFHCVSCNSGTDALFLALRAVNIGSGDEVITTPFTFFATAEAISAVGATPVFIDINPQTFNLDIEQLQSAITEKTKAILPVHLFGQPVDMTRLMAIARSHNLIVIEDCAQATGAEWSEKKVGSFGDIGCFSFFPTKNLGAFGDGGALTTNNSAIANQVRMLKNHGQSAKYFYEHIGINSRLDTIQAAILQVKLRYLDSWNEQRRDLANRYFEFMSGITPVVPPQELTGSRCVWNQYTIRVKSQDLEATVKSRFSNSLRDLIRIQLQKKGIGSTVYYPTPLHLQPVYKFLPFRQLPVVEKVCHEVLSLPIFPELSTQQQEQVIFALKDCLQELL